MQDKIKLTATLKYYAKSVLFSDVSKYIRENIADRIFEDTSNSFEVGAKMREAGYEKLADAWDNDEIDKEDMISAIVIFTDQATAQCIGPNDIIIFTVTYVLDLKKLDYAVDMREYRQKMPTDHYEQLLKGVVLYTSACNDTHGQLEELTAMGFEEADLRHFGFKDQVLSEFYGSNVLNRAIEDLDLSIRAYCCLKKTNINTVGDILKYGASNIHNIRNIGNKACEEIIRAVKDKCGIDIQE